jgi:hypothetical protein
MPLAPSQLPKNRTRTGSSGAQERSASLRSKTIYSRQGTLMTPKATLLALSFGGAITLFFAGACTSPHGTGFAEDDGGGFSSSSGSSGTGSESGPGGGGSSGFSSGGGGSGGHGSSASGSSGAESTSSSSGGSRDADAIDAPPPPPYDGGPSACGTQTCSLRTQTCCIDQFLNGMCLSKGSTDPAGYACFGCLGAVDCASPGEICCGVANTISANTACQMVAAGQCAPVQANVNMGAAQLCVTDAECTPGVQCIAQTCLAGSHLRLCGLQNAPPFNCTTM